MIIPLQRLLAVTCLAGVLATGTQAQRASGRRQSATTITIRGTTSISERQVLDLLGGRLTFARDKPPTPALADDAAFMLRRLLTNQGFVTPQVTPRISGNAIVLDVVEGPRLKLGSVFLPGLPKDDAKRLSLLFSSVGSKRELVGSQQTPFSESDIPEGLSLILADFHSRGYWDAKAAVEKRSTDPQTGEVKIIIKTEPGPLHHIGTATFSGDTRGLSTQLSTIAANSRGKPATTANINMLRSAVEDPFQSRGFKTAGIRMSVDTTGSTLIPRFTITAGTRYRRGELSVVGLERTRRESIERFRDGLQGEFYDAPDIQRRLRGLLSTGAFSGVRAETTTRGEYLDTTLQLTEAEARGSSIYAGFGNYDGFILGGRYYDRNFDGRLLNFSVGAEINDRGLLGELRLVNTWFDSSGATLGGRLFSLTRDHEGYDKSETGVEFRYSRMLADKAPLTVQAGLSYVHTEPDGIPPPGLGDTNYGHLRLRITQELDRRNDTLLPTRGWHLSGAAEIGVASGERDVSYLKFEGAASWHTTIATNHHLSLGLRAGSIIHSSNVNGLPIDLRYFLGGPDSVRSFPERELGPRARSNDPLGGEAYWVFNAEYVHQLAGPLKLVAFTDAGGLSRNFEDGGFDEVELAAGLGLRLDLPIGPIRLEYGHNLTHDSNEPSGTWHLAIGIAF